MAPPKKLDKLVAVTVRVTPQVAGFWDKWGERRGLSRAQAIAQAVTNAAEKRPIGARSPSRPVHVDGKCNHPMYRRSKGLCMACGQQVG